MSSASVRVGSTTGDSSSGAVNACAHLQPPGEAGVAVGTDQGQLDLVARVRHHVPDPRVEALRTTVQAVATVMGPHLDHLAELGWQVLRFTAAHLRDPHALVLQVAQVLAARGCPVR